MSKPDWFTREAVTGLCPQCGAAWTGYEVRPTEHGSGIFRGSYCTACGYTAPVPVDFEGRPFVPSPAPRDEARESVRQEMLDALLAASRHCQVPNGTTGALDLLARYDAALAAAPRADPTDSARIEMLQSLVVGADFWWGDPPCSVVVFALPNGVKISGDVRKWLDDCAAARAPGRAE